MPYFIYLLKNLEAISEEGILIKPPRNKLLLLYAFMILSLFIISLFSFAVFWAVTIFLFVFWFRDIRMFFWDVFYSLATGH